MSDDDEAYEEAEAISKIKSLILDFPSVERDADIRATLEKLAGQVEATDEIYPILKKKLVGSGFDARHIRKILQLSASTAKRINSTAKDFNLKEKVQRLRRIHKADLARHIAIEFASGDFCSPPTFEFFYGAIQKEGLVVKQRKKRARIDLDPTGTQTKALERDIRTDCEQDSTPKEVEAIYARVREKIRRRPRGADFLTAVVDPESFPRTVENLFHFSFLIREGRINLAKGESTSKPVMKEAKQESQPKQWNQSIMSFSMTDYKKWLERSGGSGDE